MKNLKAFEVKYLGPTNTQGDRVQIIDILRNERKTFSWNYEYSYVLDQAINIFKNNDIEIVATSELKNSYVILVEDFKTSVKNLK